MPFPAKAGSPDGEKLSYANFGQSMEFFRRDRDNAEVRQPHSFLHGMKLGGAADAVDEADFHNNLRHFMKHDRTACAVSLRDRDDPGTRNENPRRDQASAVYCKGPRYFLRCRLPAKLV